MAIMRKCRIITRTLLSTILAAIFLFSSYGSLYARDQWTEFQPLIQESLNRFINQKAPSTANLNQFQGLLNLGNISPSGGAVDISGLLSLAKDKYIKGDRNASATLFNYALSSANMGGSHQQLISTLTEIGTFFQDKGDKGAAIEYLSRAVDASLLANDDAKLQGLLKNLEPLLMWQELQDEAAGGQTTPAKGSSQGKSAPSTGGINLPASLPGVQIPNIQIPNIQIPGIQVPKSMPNIQLPNIQIPNLSIPNINIPGGGDVLSTLGNILNGKSSTTGAPNNLAAINIPKATATQNAPPITIPKVEQTEKIPVIPIPKYTPEPQAPVSTLPREPSTASGKTKAIAIPKYTGGAITTPGVVAIPHYEGTADNRTATATAPPSSQGTPAASSTTAAKPARTVQPSRAQMQQGQSTLTIRNITTSGVLPCAGPPANLRAYEDLEVRSEWAKSYLNPVPGGRYAPYATDTGLDIVAPRGRPLYAAKGGIVLYSAPSGHTRQRGPNDDQGAMRVRHPDGTDTFYAHLSGRNALLKAGSKVRQGDWMGDIGTANNVPHLHFTIYYSYNSYEGPFTTPSKLINPWPTVAFTN
jgi:murein DD-endopeptidase MepM/ murein hydrolase activator NlpD